MFCMLIAIHGCISAYITKNARLSGSSTLVLIVAFGGAIAWWWGVKHTTINLLVLSILFDVAFSITYYITLICLGEHFTKPLLFGSILYLIGMIMMHL